MAMVMDRITAAAASAEPAPPGGNGRLRARHRNALIAVGLALGVALLASLLPFLEEYPEAWEVYPAEYLNDFITWIVVEHAKTINLIKRCAFFFIMLPIKTGLDQTVTPFTWGFEFTAPLRAGYALLAAALVAWAAIRRGIGRASLIAFVAIMVYFGITRLPWPAMLAMTVLLGWRLGGPRLALGTGGGVRVSHRRRGLAAGRYCRSTCAGSRCCSRSRSGPRSEFSLPSSTGSPPSSARSTTPSRPCRSSSSSFRS